ncbi:hypothetical protein [Streptomyces sp. ST2-7A]|uniref:hypothetical protein n=1 Tax=Streptomyces sp. ST2-7A TaxID=2907214 RepID=UPI001F2FD3C6|nr:hypothetical protein [Streptomyces sp. ST2-7A]MCE7081132.1 hypothetical protein [Streptomyces sp. ST2-7A]
MTTPPPLHLTRSELARRYRVAPSTVGRALERGLAEHRADPATAPAPPDPVNPGEPSLRYDAAQMDAWWPKRPLRRGPRPPPAPEETRP